MWDSLFKAIGQVAIELQRHAASPAEEAAGDPTGAGRTEHGPPVTDAEA